MPLVSASTDTHSSGGFCNCDLNHVFGELHEFGHMQSCFSVWVCFILGEGRALNGIHYIYIYIIRIVYIMYIMYTMHVIKRYIL